MFAYCGNNPVSRIDPNGQNWLSDKLKKIQDFLEEQKKKDSSNGTVAIGITASGAFGVGGSISLGVTFDNKGNIGIAATGNAGGGFPSAGVGVYMTINNAPNIFKQSGAGTVVGASGGPWIVAVGGEYSMMIDAENDQIYSGATLSATVGLYPTVVEVHGEYGYTEVIGFNVFDVVISAIDAIIKADQGG